MTRLLILAVVLGFAGSAQAEDDFGQRFGGDTPQALEETTTPESLIEIAPAAGEETPVPEEFKSEGVQEPGQATPDPLEADQVEIDPTNPGDVTAPTASDEAAAPAPVVDGVPVTVPLETPPPVATTEETAPSAAETAPAAGETLQESYE
jgi:hypothetical protein